MYPKKDGIVQRTLNHRPLPLPSQLPPPPLSRHARVSHPGLSVEPCANINDVASHRHIYVAHKFTRRNNLENCLSFLLLLIHSGGKFYLVVNDHGTSILLLNPAHPCARRAPMSFSSPVFPKLWFFLPFFFFLSLFLSPFSSLPPLPIFSLPFPQVLLCNTRFLQKANFHAVLLVSHTLN